MATEIGIRELKNEASRIVRTVREEMAEYVITVRGEPVALLIPLTEADETRLKEQAIETELEEWAALATAIGAAWHSSKSGGGIGRGATEGLMAVIDASVFVAMLNPTEPGYAASVAWFQQEARLKKVISAPVILMAEVAAAMSRGMGNTTLAHQVIQQLSRSTSIQLYPITQSLAEQAAVIAADHRIRGCDAVYVALAQQLGETLITLDREQLQRGTAVIPTNQP